MQLETSPSSWSLNPRIANPPPGLLAKYTRKEREFYYDYATFLVRIIEDQNVKHELRRIVKMEDIRIDRSIDVRIMVFPAKGLPGRSSRILHGSYNQTFSQISLYPLKIPRNWIRGTGQTIFKTGFHELSDIGRQVICEIAITGLSTLIHEILHVKFENRGYNRYAEEAIVRKLEARYVGDWGEELNENIARILELG